MHESTVVNRLTAWSKWKMESGVALGYPSKVAFLRVGCGSDIPTDRDGHDAWCSETDAAVKSLPWLHQLIIRAEYLSLGTDVATKAHKVGIAQRTFRKYLTDSYQKIGNTLDLKLRSVPDNDINLLLQLEMRQQ